MREEEFRNALTGIDEELIADVLENEPPVDAPACAPARTKYKPILLAAALIALVCAAVIPIALAQRWKNEAPVGVGTTVSQNPKETSGAEKDGDAGAFKVYLDAGVYIELSADREGRVLDVRASGKDADRFPELSGLVGEDISSAVGAITAIFIRDGYLTNDRNAIFLTLDCSDVENVRFIVPLEEQIDAVFNYSFPEGKVTMLALYTREQTYENRLTARLAQRYDISIAKAEIIARLVDILPDKSEEDLAKMRLSDLQKLCSKYGISARSAITIGKEDALAIAADAAGAKAEDLRAVSTEYGYLRDAYALVCQVGFTYGGCRYIFWIDLENAEVVKAMETESEFSEEEATELALMKYAIDDRWLEYVKTSTRRHTGDAYEITVSVMDFEWMMRTVYRVAVNSRTGIVTLLSKETTEYR